MAPRPQRRSLPCRYHGDITQVQQVGMPRQWVKSDGGDPRRYPTPRPSCRRGSRARIQAGPGATGGPQPYPTKPPARLQPGESGRKPGWGLAGKGLGAGTDIWRTPGENSSVDFISTSATQLESYLFCLPPPKNVSPSRIQRTSRIDNQNGNQAQNERITN
uniref:Uncharacterized protein n=1 Tax=Branchiostoma floridae TaxID=7739 RepID=C3ZE92_BRAFL|eukprot:XP_002593037.1 hypothetical protein BRAFLDRAFT_74365 [Branchiostoma floridae]